MSDTNTFNIDTPICIIGAGPAGATLSLFLSKKNIEHVVVDKATFPRDKICGDGYTGEVLRVLREYSEDLYQEFINADWTLPSYGFYLEMANRVNVRFQFSKHLGKTGTTYVGKRIIFDNWLVSKLPNPNCRLLLESEVIEVEKNKKGFTLTVKQNEQLTQINCNLLIGADGERSIVRKVNHPNGIKKNREHHYAGLRAYYKGIHKRFNDDPLEFYQPSFDFRGYFWIFHLPNGECNVGIGGLSSDVSSQKIKLKSIFYQFIAEHPKLKDRFKNAVPVSDLQGWGIPINSDSTEYVGDNYMLIGDSAKFAEPFTGKGIGISMFTAFHAIPTIEKAVKNNDYSKELLEEFEIKIEKRFRKDWDRLLFAQNSFNKKFQFALFVRFLKFQPVNAFFSKRLSKDYMSFVNTPFVRRQKT